MFASTQRSFTCASSVINASSCQFFFVGKAKTMISDTCCTNSGARDNLRAIRKINDAFASGKLSANSLAGKQYLGTEAASLFASSLGQSAPLIPEGKPR